MNGIDEGFHMVRIHVLIDSVSQVGDVPLGSKLADHFLYRLRDLLLQTILVYLQKSVTISDSKLCK